jgi:hypothetical protein
MARYSKIRGKRLAETSRQMRLTEEQRASEFISPQSLARDRATTAREVVFTIGEWQHRTNVVDYRGVDVRRDNIPQKKRKSVEDLVDNPREAERLLRYMDGTQRPIRNFEEFKEAFKQSFTKTAGGNHGVRLWDTIGTQDDLLIRLYAHTNIQERVSRDTREGRVENLMGRYQIPRHRANQLFEQIRIHEIQLIQEGLLPVDERQVHNIPEQISPTMPPRALRISQRAFSGTLYSRTKPLPYNRPQERFLLNNRGVPVRKLTAQFNILFGLEGVPLRTQNSIANKRYRLSRRGEQE